MTLPYKIRVADFNENHDEHGRFSEGSGAHADSQDVHERMGRVGYKSTQEFVGGTKVYEHSTRSSYATLHDRTAKWSVTNRATGKTWKGQGKEAFKKFTGGA